MKYLIKFNENTNPKEFSLTDDDIYLYFTDYIDKDKDALKITNGLVDFTSGEGRFLSDHSYIKNVKKFRRAKKIELKIGEGNGIHIDMEQCSNNLDIISDALFSIKRFYEMTGEEINYVIDTDYSGIYIKFILLGPEVKEEESKVKSIDDNLKNLSDWIKSRGWKRLTIKGNCIEVKFSKKDFMAQHGLTTKIIKANNGLINLQNATNDSESKLVEIRNNIWNDGLEISTSGGDTNLLIRLSKRK